MINNVLVVLCLSLTIIATLQLRKHRITATARLLLSLWLLITCLISGVYLIADQFTGTGIDESVTYHLRYGLSGAGFREYKWLIISALIMITASLILTAVVHSLPLKAKPQRWHGNVYFNLALIFTALVIHPASANLFYLWNPAAALSFDPVEIDAELAEHYVIPTPAPPQGKPKNLVYLYLESLELTYFDETLFPDLVPNLRALKEQSLHFSDIHQVRRTGFTMAGITASQCGIPLVSPSHGNSMSGMDKFLPGAHCIGTFLRAQGYQLSYRGGASIAFAGKGKFLRSHGFDDVQGYDELVDQLPDREYRNSWGLYDDSLFTLAEEQLRSLHQQAKPFGLFLLTLDTHHPDGHPSKSCADHPYGDGSNPILNAVHCTDLLVGQFVKSIQSLTDDNTLMVIASDHLAMANTASDQLKQGTRRNLFMVLDPAKNTEEANSRAGSTMDIAPTVLELMGFDVAQWGLGRSLLREELTLIEREQDPDGFLRTLHPAIAKFWDWPHLDDMVVDTDQGSLMIGKRKISIPALLVLSRDRDIAEIHFDRDLHYRLSSTLPDFAANDKLIWIDHCRDIAVVDINGDNTGGDGKNFCLYAGSLNSDSPLVTTVENLALIKKAKLMAALENSGHSSRLYRQRMARAEQMSTLDTLYVSTVTTDDSIGQWLAKSGGGSGNESFLRPLTGDTGSELHFKRGLTLVALPAQGNSTELTEATKLLYIDSCEPTEEEASQSFAATIERYKARFSTYLIVANDSANCSNMDFAPLFEGLPLKLWPDIGFRQPYLALITEGEVLDEQLGNAGEAVALRVQ